MHHLLDLRWSCVVLTSGQEGHALISASSSNIGLPRRPLSTRRIRTRECVGKQAHEVGGRGGEGGREANREKLHALVLLRYIVVVVGGGGSAAAAAVAGGLETALDLAVAQPHGVACPLSFPALITTAVLSATHGQLVRGKLLHLAANGDVVNEGPIVMWIVGNVATEIKGSGLGIPRPLGLANA